MSNFPDENPNQTYSNAIDDELAEGISNLPNERLDKILEIIADDLGTSDGEELEMVINTREYR